MSNGLDDHPAKNVAAALLAGDWQAAQHRYDEAVLAHDVLLLSGHESSLMQGLFIPRPSVPETPLARYLELARSWEKFDRAFVAPEDVLEGGASARLRANTQAALDSFLEETGLPLSAVQDHLIVVRLDPVCIMSLDVDAHAKPHERLRADQDSLDARFRAHVQRI